MSAEDMYRENILELYNEPLNFGELGDATHKHHEYNPLCGDDITMQVIIEDDIVKDVKFNGKGCAISIAAASLVTDSVKGKKVEDVLSMKSSDVIELLGIEIASVRLKCALIGLEALQKAIRRE
ncbi:SUF system NifU family Fe-S cluster assembly protein [Candidatus Woesearchaeota archaeon]|nr:SUF system NifU family Fe-S cluster assembly protein [Candidatus Woesearchaeota archaeon]